LQSITFSLPFQEDGLAVMTLQNRFDLGKAFLRSLLGPALLQLLGGYLLLIGLLSLFTWRLVARHVIHTAHDIGGHERGAATGGIKGGQHGPRVFHTKGDILRKHAGKTAAGGLGLCQS
jgi:hypothetical protein